MFTFAKGEMSREGKKLQKRLGANALCLLRDSENEEYMCHFIKDGTISVRFLSRSIVWRNRVSEKIKIKIKNPVTLFLVTP